jgi:prepilin-type N-terminal cleavage/methylation domain-containing protein
MRFPGGKSAFTLIELLVVIAIIAILAVVVVLTLNPAQLLAQSRDANRVSDMATLASALNLYTADQGGASTFYLGNASNTYISTYDPQASSTCGSLGLSAWDPSTGQAWYCSTSSTYRQVNSNGWMPVNLSQTSAGSPIGNLPVDPTNQTSSGLFYAYNTNGTQFDVTADLESQKYKTNYGNAPQTSDFPEVISDGVQTISALYNPNGLIGYWPMDEGVGSSTLDKSGSGNNGTWSGPPEGSNGTYYGSGKVGNYAGAFSNGALTYVDLHSAFSNVVEATTATAAASLPSYTISVWVDRTAASPGGPIFAKLGTTAGIQDGFCDVYESGGGFDYVSYSDTTNQWYMVTMTYNQSSQVISCYYNAKLMGTNNMSGKTFAGNGNDLELGDQFYDPVGGFLDDARVYNRALSPAEVMALYDAEK